MTQAKGCSSMTERQQKAQDEREAELFRLLVENVEDYAIFLIDPQGRVQGWNPGAERLLGYREDEIIGKSAEVFFTPEDTQGGVPQREMQAAREQGRGDDDRWHVRKDGSRFWAGGMMTPLWDGARNLRGYAKIMRDRTEWKRNQDATEEQVRLAAFVKDVGLALTQSDSLPEMLHSCTEAMVRHLNGAFARIWMLNPQDNVLELRASAGLYTHLDGPHSRIPVGQYKIGLIAQERLPHLTNAVENDPRVSDQGWAKREGMVAFAGYPLVVENRLVGVMAMFARKPLSHATLEAMSSVANGIALGVERKAAEEGRRQQQEWLRVTLASIGDAVIATDTEGNVTFLNPIAERLTGWRQKEAEGQPLATVFPIFNEQTEKPVENPVEKVLREGGIVGLANHAVLRARDGTQKPIDDSAAPIRDGAGRLLGVVLIFRDVTEQRRAEHELRASEARKGAILDTALDCIITMDHEGNVVEFNPAAERAFGHRRERVIGKPLADIIIPPSLRERHRHGLAHYLATGEGPVLGKRIELPALRADGTEFPVEVAITRIPTDGPPLFTAYLRDVSDHKRIEQHRNVRIAVTHALSMAAGPKDGAASLLRAVCQNLGWDVGFYWTVDESNSALYFVEGWHRSDVTVAEFEAASRNRTFAKGEGLPGSVWSTGKPRWLLDVAKETQFLRAASAAKYDLQSAFACPVSVDDRTLGVIEFFTNRIQDADADLLEMMGTVAGNFGQFLERKKAEEQVRQSERELADFFENATVGLHWVGSDGIILRANRAELALLGYSREEYVGRPIADFHADEDVISDILNRLQAGEELHEYPARLRCKDGSIKDVLIDSSVMFRDGGFVHTRCFTRDVTERKRAAALLREQEQRTRTILESITDAFCTFDREWRFTYANRQAEVLLGRSRDDLIGKNVWEEFPDTLGTDLERNYRRAVAEAVAVTFEIFYRPHDRWYELHAYPSPDGLSVYFRDVSQRRQAREALADSEERLRLALDAGRMGVWDWNVRTGSLKWSDSLEPLHGLAPGTFGGTFEHFEQLIHPEDRGAVNASIRQALECVGEFYVEFRNVRQDGGIHWIAGSGRAFPGDDGQPLRMIGIGLDVTLRKRAEQTARFLADASAALSVLVDFDSTLQRVASLAVPSFADWASVDVLEDSTLRRVAVAHVDPAKVQLAHDLHRRFPPDPTAPSGVWNILRTGQAEIVPEIGDELLEQSVNDAELLGIMRQLGLKSYIGVPLTLRGKTLGVITFINAESGHRYDHTDLAVAEDLASRAAIAIENAQLYRELRDADRRKDEFLATLAHELRNPLAPIRSGLQVLRLAGGGGEMVTETRLMMERQLSQMVRLVDDLLDVSRITRNRLELRKERVALATVINSALETSRPLIEQSNHTFSVTLAPAPVYLDADPVRLAQVFSNLLNNAAKYTVPGGLITLTAETHGAEAVVRVRDNGLGIPADALPRIFEMFSQVDRNMEHAQGGLGIGLTLVRRMTELHGGTVEVTSDGAGKGSEFTVRIPVLNEATFSSSERISGPGEAAGTKRRILVVDDNRDAAESLGMMLGLLGNEVRTAADGLSAVEAAEQFRPDMILLDIGLPKLNGYDACRRIREQAWSGGIRIVALTGWGQDEDRQRSKAAGFDHHLVKPVELTDLQQLLVAKPG